MSEFHTELRKRRAYRRWQPYGPDLAFRRRILIGESMVRVRVRSDPNHVLPF